MMTEYFLRKKAREYFQGWQIWFSPRVKFYNSDIFTVFDGCAWKNNKFIFFQLTTSPNKSARLKKINNFMMLNNLSVDGRFIKAEVLAYNKKKKKFDILEV